MIISLLLSGFTGLRLGISIEPGQVRLQPRTEDGYAWRCLPEKQHLFAKQLSKHSVGAYMELCREVGTSFEAIAQPACSEGSSQPSVRIWRTRDPHGCITTNSGKHFKNSSSFLQLDAQLKELQAENERLLADLERIQDETRDERSMRSQAEQKVSQLGEDLSLVRDENARLSMMNENLTKQTERSDKELKKVWSVLYSLGPDPFSHDAQLPGHDSRFSCI